MNERWQPMQLSKLGDRPAEFRSAGAGNSLPPFNPHESQMNTQVPPNTTGRQDQAQASPLPPESGTSDATPTGSGKIDHLAVLKAHGGVVLKTLLGDALTRNLQEAGTLSYRTELLKACGSPSDPIAISLIDEFVWAHHVVGQLFVAAVKTQDLSVAERLYLIAARLMGETRRTGKAVKECQAPTPDKVVTVVQQKNRGNGKVTVAGTADGASAPTKKSRRNEQGSKGSNGNVRHNRVAEIFDAPADCREEELVAAAGTNGHWTPAAP